MKKCPFCAEEIQDEAQKCRFCGEFIKKNQKWFFHPVGMLILFFAVGPLALPLVWFNPSLNSRNKILITIIVSVVSFALGMIAAASLKNLLAYYNMVFSL